MINKVLATVLACTAYLASNAVDAAEMKILCASGMREVVSELQPQLARDLPGQQVSISFDEAGELRKRLQGGEIADIAILPRIVLDEVAADGNIVPATIIDISQSSIGIGVRKDAPKPDIGSAEQFKQVLLAAKAIVVGDPASGGVAAVHVANVFRRLGIVDATNAWLVLEALERNPSVEAVYSVGGGNAATVAAFEQLGRDCRVFIAHDLDADNRRLLRDGRISVVLHNDLRADARLAMRLILAERGALPAEVARPAPIQVITPFNLPAST